MKIVIVGYGTMGHLLLSRIEGPALLKSKLTALQKALGKQVFHRKQAGF